MSLANSVLRALRGIREHVYFTLVSAGVIATALLMIGIFALVTGQLRRLVATWETDAHVSAYFGAATTEDRREEVRRSVAMRPEVAAVAYVSETEATRWMVERTPEIADVLTGLGPGVLPASLEITLNPDWTAPEATATFVASLQGMGGWEDIDYGQEWVARFHMFLSVLSILGMVLGAIVVVATVFLVANTIHLIVHARRDELEILRLVGATDSYILGPFLVEGAIQGVAGAGLGLGALYAVHQGVILRAHALVAQAMGNADLPFLDGGAVAALSLAGVSLGVAGAWGAVSRFLNQIP